MVSVLAFIVTVLAAIAVLAYFLAYFLIPQAPRGFMTLLVAVLFLGAVQLLSLSVIAEYLGKIFEEVKGRPQFIVKTLLNDHRTADLVVSGGAVCECDYPHEPVGITAAQANAWATSR
jgi:hypothetical protein